VPFWSSVSIVGKPQILIMDASQNKNGWESEFCNRLFQSLQLSKLQMYKEVPISDLAPLFSDRNKFNIILLCSHKPFDIWNQIETETWLSQKMFMLCCWESYDPEISKVVMQSGAASVIVPESPTTPREAGLFYLKFLTELDLHSADQISGKMIWFSFAKAKELLKKRRYNAKFNVRC
jgi:hypothetical protein